ncbi:MAG: hypothetical protein KME64_34435 [Scytonematopsis contorta HA4267-MV1]|nr:hypothetical protein [Scytonematopsis contorta HA4267-MV1]
MMRISINLEFGNGDFERGFTRNLPHSALQVEVQKDYKQGKSKILE